MFGLSFKEKTAEALQRGTIAALTGAFFSPKDAEMFGLNEEASSWLYSEALAQQIYMLSVLYQFSTPIDKYSWATSEFAIKNISSVLIEHELKGGLAPGTISSIVFNRIDEMNELSPDERENGEHYLQSAKLVTDKDSSADEESISKTLEGVVIKYFDQAKGIFGVQ